MLALGLFLFLRSINRGEEPRVAFEKFLIEQMEVFKGLSGDVLEAMPKMDRPDLAGMQDFLRTVDPEIKTVPKWRSINAHNVLKKQSLTYKSGQNGLSWTHYPTDMGGRTRSLMFDPNDESHSKVWAASVTGGLWVSEDALGGKPWQPVNDFYTNLSISSLAYDPNNTTTFYAGTGESQTALVIYRESSGRGSGMYKSTDAGQTWELIPSTKDWAYVTDVIVRNESGQSAIYAGVVSGIYHGVLHESQPSDGLYKSTDGGDSWTQVLPLVPSGNRPYAPSDIELSGDGSRIFVGTTYHWDDREGAACILYSDNGSDWTINSDYYQQILDGYQLGNLDPLVYPGRVMISASPNNNNIVYAAIAGGSVRQNDGFIGYNCAFIVKTEDGGVNWTQKSVPMRNSSNTFAYLAWHALEITVSPINPNLVWVGGLDVWRSANGGNDWTKFSDWGQMYGNGADNYVHADIHSILFRPGSDTDLLIATDGGIFGSRSAPEAVPTFFELNKNFSTLQYYSGAIHPAAGAIHFVGGLQDNGTMFYRRGVTPKFTDMLSGGDGALCFIDEDNPKIHITTVYNNSLYLYNAEKETPPQYIRGRGLNSGMFVNAMDYNSRDDILFANRMSEGGSNPNQIEVVGVSESNFTASPRNINSQISVPFTAVKYSQHSPSGKSTIYLGSMAGHIFKQEDATVPGTLTNLTADEFPTGYTSCIEIGQSEDTVLVTFSNYGIESIWLTTDGGQTWTGKDGNLPDIPVRWALFHPVNGKQVMLATELGTWTTNNILASPVVWTQNINGMANVRVDQIKLRKSDNTVLAATHGRGMFTAIWNPEYSSGIHDIVNAGEIKVYPNPSDGQFQVSFVPGYHSQIIISDINGKVIHAEQLESSNQEIIKSFNLTNEPKGIYFIKIGTGSKETVNKILLQ